ncbi:4'-phosphopantetheinyl transferase family protein [Actinophytocola oryzae]|uniref:4'-phosphopantetheinyl transferase n=1 Tax=Actinophytocola oryzae TaxID=502181 RepID=A0A4R7V1P9_9PSEU|nr:4'-phosphopantetheinyl transferase superfamily protein [Actinophytocola oryzae]TDV41765.1 4'-phosphopantetheinyl transferase [Actinophytocola oryzae]
MRCDVWWAHPAAGTPALFELLDEVERGRYAGYRREADKLRFLTGRALIRGVVSRELGIAPGEVVLDSSCFECGKPHGKPQVVGSTLEVSISHSGEWVVLAMTDGASVGVDVEEVRDAEVDGLAGICFSPPELTTFKSIPEEERRGAFFTYWARKEAVLKATGKGMWVVMSKLTLAAHDEPPRVTASETTEVDITAVRMADLDRGPGYRACIAVFSDSAPKVDEHEAGELITSLG